MTKRCQTLAALVLIALARTAIAQETPGVPANLTDAVTDWGQIPAGPHAGQFVMKTIVTPVGQLWVATEDDGLWHWDAPNAAWQRFTTKEGLGGNSVYALACDHQGRIWAGHLREGVSVFDGVTWKTFGPAEGLPGARVYDIQISPAGDVWISTSGGLCRYNPSTFTWTTLGRAEGLPSDQVRRIGFDRDGDLYLGFFNEGLAIGRAANDYKKWELITAKENIASSSSGDGLPCGLLTDLAVSPDGAVYFATPHGLGFSTDKGQHFRYIRGKDWQENVAGAYPARVPQPPTDEGLLTEDWVASVAALPDGRVAIGHRSTKWEILDTQKLRIADQGEEGDSGIFTSLLPLAGTHSLLVGSYGGGLFLSTLQELAGPASAATAPLPKPSLPQSAPIPTAADLKAMLERVAALPARSDKPIAAFLGEDWVTQGDWVGRYGRRAYELSPFGTMRRPGVGAEIQWNISTGPHVSADGAPLYNYSDGQDGKSSSWLYNPATGKRVMGEYNDGTFDRDTFPPAFDGPDLWISVHADKGIQRVSLYFLNPNGHTSSNRMRDYPVELRLAKENVTKGELLAQPPLAQTRVADFWGGVYKQFIVSGPGNYWIRIARNHSHATRLNGIFVDKLAGPLDAADAAPLPNFGSMHFDPPAPGAEVEVAPGKEELMQSALELWAALDKAWEKPGSEIYQTRGRLLAYRAAVDAQASEKLLGQWRWQLGLWTATDRKQFTDVTQAAHQKEMQAAPQPQQEIDRVTN